MRKRLLAIVLLSLFSNWAFPQVITNRARGVLKGTKTAPVKVTPPADAPKAPADPRLAKVQELLDKYNRSLGEVARPFGRQGAKVEGLTPDLSSSDSQRLMDQSEAFFRDLAAEGLTREDLQRFRSRTMNQRGAPGESVLFGGKQYWDSTYLATERALMMGRAKLVQQLWLETLRDYFKQNPDAVGRLYGEIDIGSWVKLKLNGLSFDGDIDFSSVSSDSVINRGVVALFETKLKSKTCTSMIDADALLTPHGDATAHVFIGDWGRTFAEMDMLKRTKWKIIAQDKEGKLITDANGFPTFKDRTGEQLFWEDAFRAAENNGVFKEVRFPKITIETEPMLSLEMLRHEIHDVQKGPFERGNKLVKVLKYLERSYAVNRKALAAHRNTYPEPDPLLGDLATAVIEAKQSGKVEAIEKALRDYAGEDIHAGNVDAIIAKIEAKAQTAMHDNACRALAFRLQGISKIDNDAGRREAARKLWQDLETQIKKGNGESGVPPPETIVEAARLAKAFYEGDPTVDAAELDRRSKLLHDMLDESYRLDEPTISRLIGADLYIALRGYLKDKLSWTDEQVAKLVDGVKQKLPQTPEVVAKFTGKVKEFNDQWEKTASGSLLLRSSDFAGNALQVYDAYYAAGDQPGAGCVAAVKTMMKIKAMGALPSLGVVEGVWNAYEQGDSGPAIKAVAFYYLPAVGAFWGMGEQLQRLDVVMRDAEFITALNAMRACCVFNDKGHLIEIKTKRIDFDVPDAESAEQRANNFADVFMNDKDLGQVWDGLPEFRYWMSLIPREGHSYGYSQEAVNAQNKADQAIQTAGSTWAGKKLGLGNMDATGYIAKMERLRKFFPYSEPLKTMVLILENYRAGNLPTDSFSPVRAQKLAAFENQIERALWKALFYTLESSTTSDADLAELEKRLTELQLDLSVGDSDLEDLRGKKMGVVSQVKKEIAANSSWWTGTNQYNRKFVYERYIKSCEQVKAIRGTIFRLWGDEYGIDVQACEAAPMKFLLYGSRTGSPRLTGDPVEDPKIAEACLAAHLARGRKMQQDLAAALGRPIREDEDKAHLKILGQLAFEWEHLLDDCPDRTAGHGSETVNKALSARYQKYQDYLKALKAASVVYAVEIRGDSKVNAGDKLILRAALTPSPTGAPPAIVWTDLTRRLSFGRGTQTVFSAEEPGSYELQCEVTQPNPDLNPAVADHLVTVTLGPVSGLVVAISGPATALVDEEFAFEAEVKAATPSARKALEGTTLEWFVQGKAAQSGNALKAKWDKPGNVEIRAEVVKPSGKENITLASARRTLAIGAVDTPLVTLVLQGPDDVPAGDPATIKAVVKAGNPAGEKALAGSWMAWTINGRAVTAGASISPDTTKPGSIEITASVVARLNGKDTTLITATHRLVVRKKQDTDKPGGNGGSTGGGDNGNGVGENTAQPPGSGKDTKGGNGPGKKAGKDTWTLVRTVDDGPHIGSPRYARPATVKGKTLAIQDSWDPTVTLFDPPATAAVGSTLAVTFTMDRGGYHSTADSAAVVLKAEGTYALDSTCLHWSKENFGVNCRPTWKADSTQGVLTVSYGFGYHPPDKWSSFDAMAGEFARQYYYILGGSNAPLAVTLTAIPEQPQAGQLVNIQSAVSGGQPPMTYRWTGADGTDPNATLNLGDEESKTVTLLVTDKAGATASASIVIRAAGLKVVIRRGTPGQTVQVGSTETFTAEVTAQGKPAAPGSYSLLWQPHPEVEFAPFENDTFTTARFGRPGRVSIWAEVLAKTPGAAVVRSDAITLNVKLPALTITFTPEAPLVGTEVRASLAADPDPKDLLDVRWQLPPQAKLVRESQDAREIVFKLTDANPAVIRADGRTRFHGDDLGAAQATVQARLYTVTVKGPRALGPPPQVWDPKRGGLVSAGSAFAVHQDALFSATVSPAPPAAPLYAWTVAPEGCAIYSPASSETRVNASAKGSYALTLNVRDADGVLLGTGSGSYGVTVGGDPVNTQNLAAATAKLEEARRQVADGHLPEGIQLARDAARLAPKLADAAPLAARWEAEQAQADAAVDRAGQALAKGDLAGASTALQPAKTLHPKYEPVAAMAADIAERVKRAAEAQKRVTEGYALEKAGKLADAIARYKDALALVADPKLETHIRELEKILQDQARAQTLIDRAFPLEKKGLIADAIALYEEAFAIVKDPGLAAKIAQLRKILDTQKQAQALIDAGAQFEKKGDLPPAVGKYEQANALAPDPKLAAKIKSLKDAIDRETRASALLAQGYKQEKAGDLDKALDSYTKAYDLVQDPKIKARIDAVAAMIEKRKAADRQAAARPTPPPVKAPPPAEPAAAVEAKSLTGVFKATVVREGTALTLTMTLRQAGNRVTGRMTAAMPDGGKMDEPVNATLKGNRLAIDGGEDEGAMTVSADRNSLNLASPDGVIVFKRIN